MHLSWNTANTTKFTPLGSNFRISRPFSANIINKNNLDYWPREILDPNGTFISLWNRVFLCICLSALFIDPLYLYLPYVKDTGCIEGEAWLFVTVVVLRSAADLTYLMHIVLKFRTAFVKPGTRVIGRGELVMEPRAIAIHYLKSDFVIDFAAMLPLPQIMNWSIIPTLFPGRVDSSSDILSLIVLLQYIPRAFLIFPLNRRIIKNTGVVTKTAWAGAAYNLLLYMLASHVLGAIWYRMSIKRQLDCWNAQCQLSECQLKFLVCSHTSDNDRVVWYHTTSVFRNCDPTYEENQFNYGIYTDALTSGATSDTFWEKYLYCLWWGLKNLSSYGQTLDTSRYIPETVFCLLICIFGLVLFSHLIGNIQTYLQSISVRVEEWRVKKRDTEEWMKHRQLPPDLQERVRRFVQYKWLATRGVDEDEILRALPMDLRRDIQQHLCLGLVLRVPLFSQMDNQLLDAICERLISSLSTEGTYIVREGDPADEMLFIIRGQLESSTTNGGRSGFFSSTVLRPGDFCGEELLTWALMPNPSQNLPSSTQTVRALCEVEAFALRAEDLKYVASQFKRLHSKKLQHAFRYYSHQWRTWGACYIEAAWRRFKKRRLADELLKRESVHYIQGQDGPILVDYNDSAEKMEGDYEDITAELDGNYKNSGQHFGATVLASKFATNTKKGVVRKKVKVIDPRGGSGIEMTKILKPDDPYSFTDSDIS